MSGAIRFMWFGTGTEVLSDAPAFTQFLSGLFAALIEPIPTPEWRFTVRLGASPPTLETDGTVVRLSPANPGLHAWSTILGMLAGRVRDRWLLHGASLARDGRGLFLAAPSGFGKTTLALALAGRGFRLLADDIAPLHRIRRELEPFPRSLSLREGTRATIPLDLARRALDARRWRTPDDAEWLVDPVALLGAQTAGARPRCVVLLRTPAAPAGVRRYDRAEVLFAPGGEPSWETLRDDPELEEARPSRTKPGLVEVRARSGEALARWLDDPSRRIALATKVAPLPSSFEGLPRTRPVSIFESAIEIAQEMHNRAAAGSLGREFAGREADLVTELAESMSGCRCWSVEVGALELTADAIAGLFERDDHDA